MRKAMQPALDKELEEVELSDSEDEYPLAFKFNKWFKRLVASQKRPRNMGDKENKHNKELLGIKTIHSKFALGERSALSLWQDDIMAGRNRANRRLDRETDMRVPGQRGLR